MIRGEAQNVSTICDRTTSFLWYNSPGIVIFPDLYEPCILFCVRVVTGKSWRFEDRFNIDVWMCVYFQVGVTMAQTVLDPSLLEACVRDLLNITAPRYSTTLYIYYKHY